MNNEFGYNNDSITSAATAGSAEEKRPMTIKNMVKVWPSGGGWLAFIVAFLVIVVLLVVIVARGKGEAAAALDASAILAETGEVKRDADAINASVEKIVEEVMNIADRSNNIRKSAENIEVEVTKKNETAASAPKEEEVIKTEVVSPEKKPAEKKKEEVIKPDNKKEITASDSKAGTEKSDAVPSVLNTPVTEIYNSLDKDLYVIFYGDWDGGMIVLIRPGESIRPGFEFANKKTFRPGVHFNVFSLDNVKKDGSAVYYKLGDLFSYDSRAGCWRPKNTSLGTYYWASGNITVRDGYYGEAMSILASDGMIRDGTAKKRADGTTMMVGNTPALNM